MRQFKVGRRVEWGWGRGWGGHSCGFCLLCRILGEQNAGYPADLSTDALRAALKHFQPNLSCPDQSLRLATLNFLCSFEPLPCPPPSDSRKRRKALDGSVVREEGEEGEGEACMVLQQLRDLEAAPPSLESARQTCGSLARLQVAAEGGTLPGEVVQAVLRCMLGLLHVKFQLIWDAALACLAALVEKQVGQQEEEGGGEEDLNTRFRALVAPSGPCTGAGTRLVLLLQGLLKMPQTAAGGKEWRAALSEWLTVIRDMKNPKGLFNSQGVKAVLAERFLGDSEGAVQQLALECLLQWKDPSLLPYAERLERLIQLKTVREEVAVWSLDSVEAEHREGLLPLLIKLLMPKMMARGGKVREAGEAGDVRVGRGVTAISPPVPACRRLPPCPERLCWLFWDSWRPRSWRPTSPYCSDRLVRHSSIRCLTPSSHPPSRQGVHSVHLTGSGHSLAAVFLLCRDWSSGFLTSRISAP